VRFVCRLYVLLASGHDAVVCKLTRDASRAAKAGRGCACSYSRPCADLVQKNRVVVTVKPCNDLA
jgi:hypothetical protein